MKTFRVYRYNYPSTTQEGINTKCREDKFPDLYRAKQLANDLAKMGYYAEVLDDNGEVIYDVDPVEE